MPSLIFTAVPATNAVVPACPRTNVSIRIGFQTTFTKDGRRKELLFHRASDHDGAQKPSKDSFIGWFCTFLLMNGPRQLSFIDDGRYKKIVFAHL